MMIIIGADHRGFQLAQSLEHVLKHAAYTVRNLSAAQQTPEDDYVDYAAAVASEVVEDASARGIVICGSGAGISIAANKIHGIRCVLGFSVEQIKAARSDDDANILALASDYIDEAEAKAFVQAFLETEFSGAERHKRRIQKIAELETYYGN